MNNEIKYVSPFKKLCITVGNLPTAYIESMSYYEGLTFLVNYISNNVIPALNNNGEVVNELQDFVENYFENLDVQEEINKKLDEMAESGELTILIAPYLDSRLEAQDQEIDTFKSQTTNAVNLFMNQTTNTINSMQSQIDSVTSGSPAGVYDTLSDLETDDPDHSKIYLVLADGKWYYYNTVNEEWTEGGVYQANTLDPEFQALMENINLPEGKLYGNKLEPYGVDYREAFSYTETLGKMSGYDLTTFIPRYDTSSTGLALNLINIDIVLPQTGFLTFKRATTGSFQFYLYKENVQQFGRDVNAGNNDGGWGAIIGFTFNLDGTITLDCEKVRTKFGNGYDHCVLILDKDDRKIISSEYQIPLPDYLENFTSPKKIIIKKDGTGDYDNLRQALDEVKNNPLTQGYEIDIYPGTYNVLEDYSQAEIEAALYDGSSESFCGPNVTNKVKLIGIGPKQNIVLHGELDPDTYTSTNRNQISTLNLIGNCELENLTITSRYIRYTVHDDFTDNANCLHKIKNCNIVSYLASNGVSRGIGYGVGSKSGQSIIVEDSVIDYDLGYHNNSGFTSKYSMILNNCKIVGHLAINDTNSTVKGELLLNNTNCSYITYDLGVGLSQQYTYIKGNTEFNNPIYSNFNGIIYEFNNIKHGIVNPSNAVIGKCLRRYTLNDYGQASNLNFDGIYLNEKDGVHYIQSSGYIQTSLLGSTDTSTWAIGDLLKIDNSGILVKTVNNDEAIAIVSMSKDSDLFIKIL